MDGSAADADAGAGAGAGAVVMSAAELAAIVVAAAVTAAAAAVGAASSVSDSAAGTAVGPLSSSVSSSIPPTLVPRVGVAVGTIAASKSAACGSSSGGSAQLPVPRPPEAPSPPCSNVSTPPASIVFQLHFLISLECPAPGHRPGAGHGVCTDGLRLGAARAMHLQKKYYRRNSSNNWNVLKIKV